MAQNAIADATLFCRAKQTPQEEMEPNLFLRRRLLLSEELRDDCKDLIILSYCELELAGTSSNRLPGIRPGDARVLPELHGDVQQRRYYSDAADELPDVAELFEGHDAA